MKILSIECSATAASAAVLEDGKILSSAFSNIKLTHSQTLMPMISEVLINSRNTVSDIDAFAAAVGPGSFTGIRIGISTVKGLAAPEKTPCIPVSTLRAMAEAFKSFDCIVCAVMDARCNQVYNAIFEIKDGNITRLTEDRAVLCSDLADSLKELSPSLPIFITGDGTDIFFPFAKDISCVKKAPENLRLQNAVLVGLTAFYEFQNGNTVSPDMLLPVYLRLPQAERELKLKENTERSKCYEDCNRL